KRLSTVAGTERPYLPCQTGISGAFMKSPWAPDEGSVSDVEERAVDVWLCRVDDEERIGGRKIGFAVPVLEHVVGSERRVEADAIAATSNERGVAAIRRCELHQEFLAAAVRIDRDADVCDAVAADGVGDVAADAEADLELRID